MQWAQLFVTILVSVLGSSGFWAVIEARRKKDTAERRLLVGLAHDRITWLGVKYIERGYITQEEYANLNDYLYKPYHDGGGNGSAERVMEAVRKLPFRQKGAEK